MFSSLVKNKAEGPVIEAARRVDGRLQKLSVLALGAQPMIHADLGGKELVPLRLMGDGFSRLIEILIVIFAARGGVVLIDEIENGLHYSALPELWGAIYEASQAAGVQIFATTHSYECIKVAHEVFREHDPYRLRLHRLDFDVDKGTVVTTFDKDTLETTLEHLWEIR
jgi:AAA15 family ATPase/GTPase